MDWIVGIQNAINYIETHLTEELDYDDIAKNSFSSSFHFQRLFSLLSGYTLGEYIRNRRLTLAGFELSLGEIKVIDAALKYGYENPDSFTRAFLKFHGITPSAAREPGAKLRSFARLNINITLEGGTAMDYRIETKSEMILTGYKRRFHGAPLGKERYDQERDFGISTRAGQFFLQGAAASRNFFTVINNIDDSGYDYYISYELDQWTRDSLNNSDIMGIKNCMELFSLENIVIPSSMYAVFKTELMKKPIYAYQELRQRIAAEWVNFSGYHFADSPEINFIHWQPIDESRNRYIEIWIPIEKEN